MAAMLTTRKALPSTLLHKFIPPVRSLAAPTAVQSFTNNVQRTISNAIAASTIDRRGRPALPFKRMDDTPSFFADLFDPFIPANLTHGE